MNTQPFNQMSSINTQRSNQMSGMNTNSFEQFNSPLSVPVNVLAGEATMSNMNTQMFNVSSMNNISHPIANQSYLSMVQLPPMTSLQWMHYHTHNMLLTQFLLLWLETCLMHIHLFILISLRCPQVLSWTALITWLSPNQYCTHLKNARNTSSLTWITAIISPLWMKEMKPS